MEQGILLDSGQGYVKGDYGARKALGLGAGPCEW